MSLPAAPPSQVLSQPSDGIGNSTSSTSSTSNRPRSSGSRGESPSPRLRGPSGSSSSITSSSVTSSSGSSRNSDSRNNRAHSNGGSIKGVGAAAAVAGVSGSNGSRPPVSAVNQDVAHRFTNSGGLYALFLLLHHELCGVHPSKMASSLLTLLNMVLDASPSCKDEVRKVGGLGLLTALMGSLAKSDRVTDIFQLRVRICCSLQYVLEGNQANKLLAREHGLLDPLVTNLKHATSPDASQVSVLDDAEQVTVSTLDLLATTVDDSRGNQAALIAAGGLPLLHDLLMKPNISPTVLLAVVRVFELMVHGCEPAKLAMLGTPALPHLVMLCNNAPASPLAQRVVALCCRLVSVHAQGKAKVLASGVLPLLLKMLHTSPYGAHTSAASQGLYAVTLGDVDLQNEVAAQVRLTS
ncbi:hypothetical protein DUNSADRAFT_16341 [Dunaliella salina]|uniref:Uncharacterized protein n=1 Tax=Dunaliella salina TaxID=3046 RepID=A0ABQ7H112_DUNSA|nr:hypothetical protein DUNSADRAFT_16341 [Dunaliella salina]KAF5840544.1 hypothetical protein DUNSADRAFT_16341 [Dunaliella salina]|eukprot:KAF5840543.1 hypothetical protein DUNSADRAFT_16341 [Dunaliella salina]